MSGPFLLKQYQLFITRRSAGAFILSRDGRSADYVGSSSDDLGETLRRFASQSAYRYFWFAWTSAAKEAQQLEQAWRHRYRPTDVASGTPGDHGMAWRCTTEGCAACALAGSRR
jgi:hypothetical protein